MLKKMCTSAKEGNVLTLIAHEFWGTWESDPIGLQAHYSTTDLTLYIYSTAELAVLYYTQYCIEYSSRKKKKKKNLRR